MITQKEIKNIDSTYFNILQINAFTIYLQSKNTNHFWGLHLASYRTHRNFKIYHKHHRHNEYHRHSDAKSINSAINHIKKHDIYHLNKVKNKSHSK